MSLQSSAPIHVIGGGLAGCEAAWQIIGSCVPVVVHEMRAPLTFIGGYVSMI